MLASRTAHGPSDPRHLHSRLPLCGVDGLQRTLSQPPAPTLHFAYSELIFTRTTLLHLSRRSLCLHTAILRSELTVLVEFVRVGPAG